MNLSAKQRHANPSRYQFAEFELRLNERRLLAGDKPVVVTPRAFDVLVVLVERAGTLVTKDELFDRVWPRLVVEENNLQVQISALRKILGAHAIETVSGHGYRLTHDVHAVGTHVESRSALKPLHLPLQSTSFVGREQEIAEIRQLLDSTRLLTLVGVGGIGKTRLCLRVATEVLGDYPDGVAFVDLAPLSDPRLIAPAIATALGIAEQPDCSIIATLSDRLQSARVILILDNCEHLLEECARLTVHLLQEGPQVRVLATSREPLRVGGETSYALKTLPVPDPRQPTGVDLVSRSAAAHLFVDRATAANPGFALTADNAKAVARICVDLDGIPLALELAATRVRSMSVEAIANRLTDRFRLLKVGDQTVLPRQQTLRAMIDWSYDLLAAEERALLATFGVFTGGFTLEAAEFVGPEGDIREQDVLDLLSNLVEKSLVVHDAARDRYRLLETVRQYALERLEEAGKEQAARARQLQYCVRLARKAEFELLGPNQAQWHVWLESERENILAAHAFCDRVPEGTLAALELIHALRPWMCRDQLRLWHRICEEALARPAARQHVAAVSEALYAASAVAYFLGCYGQSREWGSECHALATQTGHALKTMDAHILLGNVCLAQGDRDAAEGHFNDGLAMARQFGDRMRIADASVGLAELLAEQGNLAAAEPLYEQAIEANRLLGNRDGTLVSLVNLARVAVVKGADGAAVVRLCDALELGGEECSAQLGQMLLTVATGLAARRGEWRRAARYFGAAEAQLAAHGNHREPADEAFLAPLVAGAREAIGPAEFDDRALEGRALGGEAALAEVKVWLAATAVGRLPPSAASAPDSE